VAPEQNPSRVADDASQASVPGLFVNWLGAVGERFRTSVDLAFAETRLAISTFMLMIVLSIPAAGALLTVARRRDDRNEQSGDGEHRPGPLEQAGDLIRTLVRWGVTASQLRTMATTPSQGSPAAEAAREG
jgi:hypothetical protein